MSDEKLSELQAQYESIDKEFEAVKAQLMEKLQAQQIASNSEVKQFKLLEEEKNQAVEFIRNQFKDQKIDDNDAPKMYRQLMTDLTTQYNSITAKSEELEEKYKKQRVVLKESKRNRVLYDQLSDAKAYMKFFNKRIEKMRADVEESCEEITYYIKKSKKKMAKYFESIIASQKETTSALQSKLTIRQNFKNQAVSAMQLTLEKQIYIFELMDKHINDAVSRIDKASNKCVDIKQKVDDLVCLHSSLLMRSFLRQLFIKQQVKNMNDAFVKYCKSPEGHNIDNDSDMIKIKSEIEELEKEINESDTVSELMQKIAQVEDELAED